MRLTVGRRWRRCSARMEADDAAAGEKRRAPASSSCTSSTDAPPDGPAAAHAPRAPRAARIRTRGAARWPPAAPRLAAFAIARSRRPHHQHTLTHHSHNNHSHLASLPALSSHTNPTLTLTQQTDQPATGARITASSVVSFHHFQPATTLPTSNTHTHTYYSKQHTSKHSQHHLNSTHQDSSLTTHLRQQRQQQQARKSRKETSKHGGHSS